MQASACPGSVTPSWRASPGQAGGPEDTAGPRTFVKLSSMLSHSGKDLSWFLPGANNQSPLPTAT